MRGPAASPRRRSPPGPTRGTDDRSRAVPPRYLVARRSCRSCTRCTVRDRDPTPPAPPRNATRPGAGDHLGGSRNDGGRTRSVRVGAIALVGGNGVAGHRAVPGVWEGAWEGRGVDALRATRLGGGRSLTRTRKRLLRVRASYRWRGHRRQFGAIDRIVRSDRASIDVSCIRGSRRGAIGAAGPRRHGKGGARHGDWGFGLVCVVVGVI